MENENSQMVKQWAENWIMDHIDGENGKSSTKDAWLKMLRSGNILQCDKVTKFMVSIQDEALREESKIAFREGLLGVGVDQRKVDYILADLFK